MFEPLHQKWVQFLSALHSSIAKFPCRFKGSFNQQLRGQNFPIFYPPPPPHTHTHTLRGLFLYPERGHSLTPFPHHLVHLNAKIILIM